MAATLALNASRRELTVTLGGGDQVPDHINWSTSPPGYLRLTPLASEADVAGLFPILAGIITCTASLRDAFDVELQAVSVNVQITGTDAESMQLATTGSSATVPTPYTPPAISANVAQQAHEAAVSAPAAVTSAQNATAAATDLGTSEALANALKANYNAAQADIVALQATVAALVTGHNALVAALQAATILHT